MNLVWIFFFKKKNKIKAARADHFQQSAWKCCQAWSPEVFQTCVLMDQTCSCRLPVSDGCLIICEKLRREFTSKAKHPLPMMLVSSLVSYISLFNGTVSRIALWNQTPEKKLQSLLGHSKFSSFFSGLLPASRSNDSDPAARFGFADSQAGFSV